VLLRAQNSCLTGNELDWRAATKKLLASAVKAKKLLVGQHDVLTHNTFYKDRQSQFCFK
jgi:hypothetical protein